MSLFAKSSRYNKGSKINSKPSNCVKDLVTFFSGLTGVSVTFTSSICVTLFTLCGVTVVFLVTTVLGDFLTVDLTAEEETQRAAYETEGNEERAAVQAHKDLKASAKAKLIAGEALTEDEANTIVL